MLTIDHQGPYAYVSRSPTDSECNRYIGNGYRPPSLVNERDPNVYDYARGKRPPNYPVPTLIGTVENDGYCVDILGTPDYGANLDTIKYPWKYANHEKVTPVLAWFIRNR